MKPRHIIIILVFLTFCIVYFGGAFYLRHKNAEGYTIGVSAMEDGDYELAIYEFENIMDGYMNTKELLEECYHWRTYNMAGLYVINEEYLLAIKSYASIIDFQDSEEKLLSCCEKLGIQMVKERIENKDEEIIKLFEEAFQQETRD